MFRTTALLVSVLVSTTVGASEWWFIGIASGENTPFFFVDKESLATSGKERIKFWEWRILSKDDQSPWGTYRTSKSLNTADCQSKKLGVARVIFYDSNGHVVDSVDNDNRELIELAPDSIGEAKRKFVCSRGNSPEPGQTWAIDPEAYAERFLSSAWAIPN